MVNLQQNKNSITILYYFLFIILLIASFLVLIFILNNSVSEGSIDELFDESVIINSIEYIDDRKVYSLLYN